jgi:hypothetical protein
MAKINTENARKIELTESCVSWQNS